MASFLCHFQKFHPTLNDHSSLKIWTVFLKLLRRMKRILKSCLLILACLLVVHGDSVALWSTDKSYPICSDSCEKNEVYTVCGGALECQESCDNSQTWIATTCACVKGCACVTGFVRDPYTMKCIPRGKCSSVPMCPGNEEWSSTKADCQNTCDTMNNTFLNCQEAGCVCKPGFIRRSDRDRSCIPMEKCNGCPANFAQNADGVCELSCNECNDPNAVYNDLKKKCECMEGLTFNSRTQLCSKYIYFIRSSKNN